MSTHNVCFEQKYEEFQNFLSEKFSFFGGNYIKLRNRSALAVIC